MEPYFNFQTRVCSYLGWMHYALPNGNILLGLTGNATSLLDIYVLYMLYKYQHKCSTFCDMKFATGRKVKANISWETRLITFRAWHPKILGLSDRHLICLTQTSHSLGMNPHQSKSRRKSTFYTLRFILIKQMFLCWEIKIWHIRAYYARKPVHLHNCYTIILSLLE